MRKKVPSQKYVAVKLLLRNSHCILNQWYKLCLRQTPCHVAHKPVDIFSRCALRVSCLLWLKMSLPSATVKIICSRGVGEHKVISHYLQEQFWLSGHLYVICCYGSCSAHSWQWLISFLFLSFYYYIVIGLFIYWL